MRLTQPAVELLSNVGTNQFRGALSTETFSNRNGSCAPTCARIVPAARMTPFARVSSLHFDTGYHPQHVKHYHSAESTIASRFRLVTFGNTRAGARRVANGSDTLGYFGCQANDTATRPQLLLTVSGPGPEFPQPSPAYPRGSPGTIVAGGFEMVEITCDGGACECMQCGATHP
jgi:hypothetical protein